GMDVVRVQDALQESDIRLDEGRTDVLDVLRHLAFVAGRVAKGAACGREQEGRDREDMLHRPTPFQGGETCRFGLEGEMDQSGAPHDKRSQIRSRKRCGRGLSQASRGERNRWRGREAGAATTPVSYRAIPHLIWQRPGF